MAKILNVYECFRCAKCRVVGARWKLEDSVRPLPHHHTKRIRNRWMKRLQAKGWKFQACRWWMNNAVRKWTRAWCPECATNKRHGSLAKRHGPLANMLPVTYGNPPRVIGSMCPGEGTG